MIVMTMKFDTETIRLMALFENLTGASVKDCILDNSVIYIVVDEGEIGVAIGKNGASVQHAEKKIGKMIKLFEYSKDIAQFVKNLIPQTTDVKIRNENEKVIVEIRVDKADRAIVIGRDGKNLKLLKELLQRNYTVNDLIIR